MEYPKSTNIKKWEQYLERKLDITEKRLLHNASQEVQLNKCIYNLIKNIKNKNLYIPTLSVSDGNCLYDSICYKLKDNTPMDIRNIVSSFMKLYKKYPDIFLSQNMNSTDMTLEEMFACQNDIDYIYDKNTNKLYRYTYDVMCADLACDNSWQRLPVELILMCISFLYDVKIIICHDNGYTHEIIASDNITDTIYLGLLGEFHYIPLEIKKEMDAPDIIDYIKIYNNYMDSFHTWIEQRVIEKKNKINID